MHIFVSELGNREESEEEVRMQGDLGTNGRIYISEANKKGIRHVVSTHHGDVRLI